MGTPRRKQIIQFTPELKAEFEKRVKDYLTTSNHSTLVSRGRKQNQHLKRRSEEGAAKTAAWAKAHPVLNTIGLAAGAAPFAVAAYPGAVVGGELLGTALANPYVDAGLTSVFGAHGLNHAVNEGITDWKDAAMTTLEVIPLGRLARPLYEGVIQPGMRLFNSPLTGNWTKIGNKEYRLSPSVLGANGSHLESKPIKFKSRSQLGKYFGNGSEQTVYDIGDGYLHKVYEQGDLYDKKSLEEFVERFLKNRNSIKLLEPILYVGYLKEPNIYGLVNYFPVFKLKKLLSIKMSNKEFDLKIREWLQKNNYNDVVEEGVFTNGEHTLIDVSPDNIGYADGKLRFFDVAKESKASAPQITAENTTNMTPEQWTARQDAAIAEALNITPEEVASLTKEQFDAAIAKGADMTKVQKLRDLHFKENANTKLVADNKEGVITDTPAVFYHSTEKPLTFTAFDLNRSGLNWTYSNRLGRKAIWFEPNYSTEDWGNYHRKFYIKSQTPYMHPTLEAFDNRIVPKDADAVTVSRLYPYPLKYLGQLPIIKAEGKVIPNMQTAVFDSKNIKSADAVTFDPITRKRIPLGARDNFKINDIGYGLLPFLGLGTASTLYKKRQGGKLIINNKLI